MSNITEAEIQEIERLMSSKTSRKGGKRNVDVQSIVNDTIEKVRLSNEWLVKLKTETDLEIYKLVVGKKYPVGCSQQLQKFMNSVVSIVESKVPSTPTKTVVKEEPKSDVEAIADLLQK